MTVTKYTKKDRLADVIRLISVLAIDKHTFRSEKSLGDAIRGMPESADNWFQIAAEHPEFFRLNGSGKYIALLIRSYLPLNKTEEDETREPLGITETQKLIDVAISLHDKEILRKQRNAFWIPVVVALISTITALSTTYYNVSSSSSDKNYKPIQDSLRTMQIELRAISTKISK